MGMLRSAAFGTGGVGVLGKLLGYRKGQEPDEAPGSGPDEVAAPGVENNNDPLNQTHNGSEEMGETFRLFERTSVKSDKTVLDLVIAVEQVISEKRLLEKKAHEYQDRFRFTQRQMELVNNDLAKTKDLLAKKEEQTKTLEDKLTSQNMRIDQLLEDYRGLQAELVDNLDELRNKLDIEQNKYQRLQEQLEHENQDAQKTIRENRDTIVRLESENAHLKQQYERIRQENNYLLNLVNDFTNQMSASLPSKKVGKTGAPLQVAKE